MESRPDSVQPGPRALAFFLDGPSAAGKTSIAMAASATYPDLQYVRRYTTRQKTRPSDLEEYIFVQPSQFNQMIDDGEFIEYRQYEFGMAYGLRRRDIQSVLDSGKNALCITNLGRNGAVRKGWPDAICILISVSLEEIERRLRARGTNTEPQIQERLANAKLALSDPEAKHDFILENSGTLESAVARLHQFTEASAEKFREETGR